jgi:type II secretion system protein I
VVIALAIVAVAMLAIAEGMNQHTAAAAGLEKRVLASWVASSQIALLRHDAKLKKIKTGSYSDTIKMGGHKWRARSTVKKTDVKRVFLVTVTVRSESARNEAPYATLTTAISDSFK